MDPVNCFEHEQTDYTKYDELVGALQLSALELAILNCYMNGMVQSEVCAELGIGRATAEKQVSAEDITTCTALTDICRLT